ncbi:PAS domain-containing protein, partial [Halobium palmae]
MVEQRTKAEGYGRTSALYEPPANVDETERLRHERNFWKHLFEDLVEEFPEPVLVVDDGGSLTHWNAAQEEAMGRGREEVLGKHVYDVIGTESQDETLAETLVRTGDSIREEEVRSGVDPNGEPWHIRAAGQPLRGPDGRVVGAFEYVSWVTELVEQRRRIERVQERISHEVETAVAELLEASRRVADGSGEIDAVAGEQAENLLEVRAEMESLSATVEEIASSADEVSR